MIAGVPITIIAILSLKDGGLSLEFQVQSLAVEVWNAIVGVLITLAALLSLEDGGLSLEF